MLARAGLAMALLLAGGGGCATGSDTGEDQGNLSVGAGGSAEGAAGGLGGRSAASGTSAIANAGGWLGTSGGNGGAGLPGSAGSPGAAGRVGIAGSPAAGSSPGAGGLTGAGGGADVGGGDGGEGFDGSGGLDGSAGGDGASGSPGVGGASDPGNHFIRGPAPTEASATTKGPYTVQSYSTGFRVGPSFPGGTVWYPSDAEAPFASIAIVPGFVSPRILIEAWGPFLASHGIVTFTIDTNAITDQPAARSRALLNALESLKEENTRSGSPLSGKLDNSRQAVGGWSMGGGGTLITVNGNPELKAAIAMCSWSPGGRYSSNRVPTLLFASSGDPLAGGQSQGFYRSIPESTPKMLFEWGLADHFLANDPVGATGQVGRYGLSWLKVFLEGDERYRQFLEKECDGCTDFQTNL